MNKLAQFLNSGMKSLRREKYYALINIMGLGLGIFCFLLTSLYVKDELTHDKWHKNAENIYLPEQILETGAGSMVMLPSFAIGQAWMDEVAGVKDVVNISADNHKKYEVEGEEFETRQLAYTTSALFRMFDFELSQGDPAKALAQPDGIVISYEMANKHFKGQNPMGERIEVEGLGAYQVTGVLKPIPSNSHLQFELIVPIDFTKDPYKGIENNWQFGHGKHYVLIEENYGLDQLASETSEMVKKHTGKDEVLPFQFHKFSELYMMGKASTSNNMFGGQTKYVIIFTIVGALMLLVASFNYINLTTSRSFARAKDFAIRKVVGASKSRLVLIQLGETFFIALLGLIIAIIALEISLSSINELIGKNLSLQIQRDSSVLVLPVGVLILVMLLSGLYPAFIGSRFNLSSTLKGKLPNSKGAVIRKVLIVIQFTICTGVLASALIIRFQAKHMINMDLGYNAQNIINVEMRANGVYDKMQAFRNEMQRSTLIEKLSSGPLPSVGGAMIMDVGEGENKSQQFFAYASADKGFIEIAGLEILAGSTFDNLEESELKSGVIVNEAALELFGMSPEEAINEKIQGTGMKIVGVIKNYHTSSAKSKVTPQIISYNPEQLSNVLIRYKAGDEQKVVAHAEAVWEELGITVPLKYQVIENAYDNAFKREEALISIFDGLTAMLIGVAGLGLFALAVFESQIREKELCIRKVLGANPFDLLRNLNMRFVLLIVLAMVISIPITQYLIGSWLESFPYRIESTTTYFIISSGFVLILAILMLSIQGVNSVRKNPAEVLRNE